MDMTQIIPKNGLLGYYFSKPNLQDLLFISSGVYTDTNVETNAQFVAPHQPVQAVKWIGRIKPEKTGRYIFSTSDDAKVILKINEHLVINHNKKNMIPLQENQFYTICLEYSLSNPTPIKDLNLSLFWYLEKTKNKKIPETSIYLPDFTQELNIFHTIRSEGVYYEADEGVYYEADEGVDCDLFPDDDSCKKNPNKKPDTNPPQDKTPDLPKPILDSDGDGIPDDMETLGYTVLPILDKEQENPYFQLVPWLKEYDQNPVYYEFYPKYVSNPYDKNTVGDPYTDFEKAAQSIYIKGKVLKEAYHPLVAACPSVAVFMEKMIFIPKEEVDKQQAEGVTYRTSFGIENTHTVGENISNSKGTDLEFNGDLEKNREKQGKPKKNLSGKSQGGIYRSTNLMNTTTQTTATISTVQEQNMLSTKEQKTIHSMDSGVLSGALRYSNMGTAPISEVQPSISFLVGKDPVSSFTPKNPINYLEPGRFYPPLDSMETVVISQDLFNGHPTSIDSKTKDNILAGHPVQIQTLQIGGSFTGAGGLFPKDSKQQWATVLPGIFQKTARLTLETPDEILDRRVAAPSKDKLKPNDAEKESHTPHLTLEQAMQIAFGARKDNRGQLVITTENGMTYKLDRYSVNVYVDAQTDDLIIEQLKAFQGDDTKSIYDVTLTKEMVILIKPILEITAFLSNQSLYIENQTDESLSYNVWKEAGSESKLLKTGIVPPASTIGTGYLCENPAEELYITVSRRVSQVIFKGTVSALTGFVEEKLLPEGKVIRGKNPVFKKNLTNNLDGTLKGTVRVNYEEGNLDVEYEINPGQGRDDVYWKETIDTILVIDEQADPTRSQIIDKTPEAIESKILHHSLNKQTFSYSFPMKKPIQYVNLEYATYLGMLKQYHKIVNDNLAVHQTYTKKLTNKQIMEDFSELAIYEHKGFVYLYNKSNRNISYSILNTNQHVIYEGNLSPEKDCNYSIYDLTRDWGVMYTEVDDNTLIFTVNDKPVYKITVKDIINDDKDPFSNQIQKAHHIDYWHINSFSATYDSIYFQKIDPKLLGLLTKYEIKVKGTVLSKNSVPVRSPELDGKIMINFFDYAASGHPQKGDQVEIIAHDIFRNTHTVFSGKAELSDSLWKEHYKMSEWHKKGNDFDALYLSPVPTGLTESVKSYDIQIDTSKSKYEYKSVSFERQDNGGYIRDQRLKWDVVKYFTEHKISMEKLPKRGDSITLVLYTMENQTVLIDLGKIEESALSDSINALEKVHEIVNWKKDKDYYTRVQFNTGSEHITSYVFKVNSRYYGEIPVKQATNEQDVTKELDLSNLDTGNKIQKGDYVEIYAYKKDGEGVLIQSRYAGTTGFIGAYPTKETIQLEYHITSWSKVTDAYTSFTLGPLSDPIDSYIKKYEGWINNQIVTLTQESFTFKFEAKKEPLHGDIVQLFAYTYSGDKIELWKLPAGVIGEVKGEEIRSIHQLTGWEDTNKTIVFDTSTLRDPIQAHIKSYTIEVWKGQNTNWETFGSPIQMDAQGQLHLQDCNAKQDFPKSPNVVRVLANFYEDKRTPVVVMVRKVGEIKPPPTQKDIEDKHKDFIWNFDQEKLKSITFPHVDSETASYIASYQVKKWSEQIKIKTFQVDNKGVTVEFDNLVDVTKMQDVSDGPGKMKQVPVTAEFSACACCINIEKDTKLQPILVIGTSDCTNPKGVIPHPPISTEEIKKAHIIEEWDYTGDNGKVRQFYFNKKIESYIKDIKYYLVQINGLAPPKNPDKAPYLEKEEKHTTTDGYPIRFSDYGLTDSQEHRLPKSGDTLDVIAHFRNSVIANGEALQEISVITNYKIPSEFSPLSKEETLKLKNAHHIDGHWVKSGNVFTMLFFNEAVEPYLKQIDFYSIAINGVEYKPTNKPNGFYLEEEKDIGLQPQKGLPIRFESLGVGWGDLPTDSSSIEIFANLKAPGGTDESNQPTTKVSVYRYGF